MGETTRLNVPSMFDLSAEAVRCDRNDVLPLLTRGQHATNKRVIRVNNLTLVIKLYLRRGKFIICCRVWRLDDSHWRKQSLGPVFPKTINTNITDFQADEIIKWRRHLCCPHTASVLQFLSYTRNVFYCHKYTNTRRFGTSLLPSSGGDAVVWKWKKKYCEFCWFYSCTTTVKNLYVTSTIRFHRGEPAWHDAANTGPEQP